MEFPTIPIWGSIQRSYALGLFYFFLLVRLGTSSWIAIVILTWGIDMVRLALGIDGVLDLTISVVGEIIIEVVLINFFAIRVFRLLLLEHSDERTVFDNVSLNLMPGYMRYFAMILTADAAILVVGYLAATALTPFIGVFAFFVFAPFVLAAVWVYAWLSFVLPAASIPVPYRFQESSLATRGTLPRLVFITVAVVLPWFLLSWFAIWASGIESGLDSLRHWLMVPVIAALHCARSAAFVVVSAVCFEERTGWQPGAEKVDF